MFSDILAIFDGYFRQRRDGALHRLVVHFLAERQRLPPHLDSASAAEPEGVGAEGIVLEERARRPRGEQARSRPAAEA